MNSVAAKFTLTRFAQGCGVCLCKPEINFVFFHLFFTASIQLFYLDIDLKLIKQLPVITGAFAN